MNNIINQIVNLAEEFGYYTNLDENQIAKYLGRVDDLCAEFTDGNGEEASDHFYECLVDIIENN